MQIANHTGEKWTFFHQFNLGPDFLVYSFSEITLEPAIIKQALAELFLL